MKSPRHPQGPAGPWGPACKSPQIQLFLFAERRFAEPKANETKNWHNFQDQTFTEKLITPPKYTYKMGLNELSHTSGTFFSPRLINFWGVRTTIILDYEFIYDLALI